MGRLRKILVAWVAVAGVGVCAMALVGCGGDAAGGGAGGGTAGSGPGATGDGSITGAQGDVMSAGDAAARADAGGPSDAARDAGPTRDTAARGGSDAGAAGDASAPGGDGSTGPAGTQAVGAACTHDGDCADGLCLVTQLGGACTLPCADQASCSDALGLDCVEIRPGQGGCMPQLLQFPDTCTSHAECPFPLRCRADTGYCSVAECLWDADCPAGQSCDADARACEPATCAFDDQCAFPGERCVDGACGPPTCLTDAACEGDQYCHPVQQTCATPSTCTPGDDEDGCFYNETCEGGLCLPNPCWNGCPNPAHQCDPATGACGAACAGAGAGACGAGQACHSVMGICYDNVAPVAAGRVQAADGSWATGAFVAFGEPAHLSAAASGDPEGEVLSYVWTVALTPPGSAHAVGEGIGAVQDVAFTPDVPGLYLVALVAVDPGGLAGITDQVVVYAE